MAIFLAAILLSILAIWSQPTALAVPPPDFIFNIGSQIAQFFSFLVLGLAAVAGIFKRFLESHPFIARHKKLFWASLALFIIGLSFLGAYYYDKYKQKQAYKTWVKQSQQQNKQAPSPISEEVLSNIRGPETQKPTATDNLFFKQNEKLPVSISNEEFRLISESRNVYVLDAREDEEYEYGNFPGSNHIRFADLLEGRWETLPQDRVIYVLCWSGIRGKEVAEFLRTNKIVSRYLEKGADGWVSFGGKWNGEIKFLSKYPESRYQIVFSTEEVKNFQKEGVVLVDSRHPDKYAKKHIPGSISIPTIYTPTSKMENALSQVAAGSRVVTICDDFVSCFDAKITGVKLERKGNIFLGRFNKPWDF